ncbi:MAG: CinA family protein [Bacilli bacterium]|jgi:PncC family amidohydrolase
MNAEKLYNSLKNNHLTIGSIESVTGGLFASTITSIPGSSLVYKGSVVSYSVEEKINIVGIKENSLKEFGIVSSQIAIEMASLGAAKLGVDLCLSCTGNAGPSVCEDNKPVGKVFIGIFYQGKTTSFEKNFVGSRDEIRLSIVQTMIDLAYLTITK